MARHSMYDETPKIEHDGEGKAHVKKSEKKKEPAKREEASASSGLPTHVRHAAERRDMHSRHEMEHSVHDASNAGSKSEMHTRHIKEKKDMFTRHEKDTGATSGSNDVGIAIKDIRKGA